MADTHIHKIFIGHQTTNRRSSGIGCFDNLGHRECLVLAVSSRWRKARIVYSSSVCFRSASLSAACALSLLAFSGCGEDHRESAQRMRLGVPEDPATYFDAKFGDREIRIPAVSMIADVSEGHKHELSSLTLKRSPWPPDSSPFNMVPEGRYLQLTLYAHGRRLIVRREPDDAVDDQSNWGQTGMRRLVYDLGHTLGKAFGSKVFETVDGQLWANCSAGYGPKHRACLNSDIGLSDQNDNCHSIKISEIIETNTPSNYRCEAIIVQQDSFDVIYEFPEKNIAELPRIDSFVRELVESWETGSKL